ncbi:hypothetical protein HRR83_004480 [Exophiala dermatitidis]|uniref:Isoflavone reductase (CipA) n=2 Tax=Exophiala dermatitidis TaxID=5970 RepID=H6BQL9_EXODN|nr:isoflavone reductase (CipA) [Exophiala dermatitidis NIH/UT8656]KAJ4515802.1 hypothetical protein HRR75_003884 [Exophiala dermatitidis]EHY53836.1 isoflavone reductase (CipA) [Exophiala dermatitidis NIH/UT8656]KAJ4519496.1 hypothetical protein HRR74_004240 [Exophiala dermatitidis]KAJ4529313.1 hypothetical protein HRR73_000336 [Exophiala dermatitidis]KAJ4544032.1 hypothetical protein HRR76_002107 [Exophiala dermatitidis]
MAGVKYAKDQPAGFKNHVENIAIVGASGHIGAFIAHELLKTKIHKVTALTRAENNNTNKFPPGLSIIPVNYSDPSTLVNALRGQDVLIITMSAFAPRDTEAKLIQAAADAGVPWVMPNEWGLDGQSTDLVREAMTGPGREAARNLIASLGKSSFVSLVCGFWYEFSLAGQEIRFGFDFPNRTVTFYDDGQTKINVSTWAQCGRAVARLWSLKIMPDDEKDTSPTVSTHFRNGFVYISSFLLSQRDMFESVLRVTGTTEQDWKIQYQDVKQRYREGLAAFQNAGDMMAWVKAMYARDFWPDGSGNYQAVRGLHNRLLGLPDEDLDERTKVAIDMVENGDDACRPKD